MIIKKIISAFIISSLCVGGFSVFADSPTNTDAKSVVASNNELLNSIGFSGISGTFYADSSAFTGHSDFSYNNSYFENSAYMYNHNLSKLSMKVSFAAFRKTDVDYALQSTNISDMLGKMGFSDISANEHYKTKPETNTLGIITGNKKITVADKEYTLIAAAVRGGNYENEWGGNFSVGKDEHHKGFSVARDIALSHITDYIKRHNITGDIKLWITGYSRGAAVTNLTAAYLDENPGYFGEGVNLTPENLYAYCFETPGATTASGKSDTGYSNIYNIINQNDFVPMVAPEDWGFGRYGVMYYLPSEKTHDNYSELSDNMYTFYDKYVKEEYNTKNIGKIENFRKYEVAWSSEKDSQFYGFYLKDTETKINIGDFYTDVLDSLLQKFQNRENYVSNYEPALMDFAETLLGGGASDKFLDIFTEELYKTIADETAGKSPLLVLGMDVTNLIFKTMKSTFQKLEIEVEDEELYKISELLSNLIYSRKLETMLGNADILGVVHYPELCMAWLDSTKENEYIKVNTDKGIVLTIDKKYAVVAGKILINDVAPVIRNDRTMLPARFVAENLGASVEWNSETKTVLIKKDDISIELQIGSETAVVNGVEITLDSPAFIENDRTYTPVRFICENLGASVDWNASDKSVSIL